MKNILRLIAISLSVLFITGCVSIIPLENIENQTIASGLSEQQIKESMHKGIEAAGWTIESEAPGKILATFNRRVHTIAVNIRYTNENYNINYAYSTNMKMHCTEGDKVKGAILTKWPEPTCGGSRPQFIHAAYNKWVGRLSSEINTALSSN